MKILFTVEFYEPRKGGAEEVLKQLAERLVSFGHSVTVATTFIPDRSAGLLHGVTIESFHISGNIVRGIQGSASEIARYRSFLLQSWDVVINYAAQIWTTDLTFEVLGKIHGRKILVPCGYSGLYDPSYGQYFMELPAHLREYDTLVYMSEQYQDKLFGDQHGVGNKAMYIPNGAAEEEFLATDAFNFRKRFGIKTKHLVITVSNHYRAKGHAFSIEAMKVANRKDVSLAIIGEIPGKGGVLHAAHVIRGCYKNCFFASLMEKNIRVIAGKNREMVVSAYKESDAFLFGSEIECAPLVMYESFAAKTLFVTRDVGNVKDHKEYIKIVSTPVDMATTMSYYLDHPKERKEITDIAFEAWRRDYTWHAIAKKYEKLFA